MHDGDDRLNRFGRVTVEASGALLGLLCCLIFMAGRAGGEPLCTDTWTGPSAGAWETGSNWSTEKPPASTGVACIGSGDTATITGEITVGVLQGEGSVVLSDRGTLEITNAVEASHIGTLSLVSGGTELTGAGTVDVKRSLTWTNGIMSGPGSTVLLAGGSGSFGDVPFLSGRTLINRGTMTLGQSQLRMEGNAVFENAGVFTANSAFYIVKGSGAPRIVNSGTWEKTEGALTQSAILFENTGTVEVLAGTLGFLSGGSSTSGEWRTAEGASVDFEGAGYSLSGGSLSGHFIVDGNRPSTVSLERVRASGAAFSVTSGGLSVPSGTVTIAELSMHGGEVLGAGTLALSRALTWDGGEMAGSGATILQHGAVGEMDDNSSFGLTDRTFINAGTLDFSTGELYMFGVARFENAGILVFNTSYGVRRATGSPVIVNTGTLEKTEPTGPPLVVPEVENLGTIREESGHIEYSDLVNVAAAPSTAYGAAGGSEYGGGEGVGGISGGVFAGCGDPISCATGNFSETQTDLAVGGRGVGLDLVRTYNSRAAAEGIRGAFGYGWSSSFSDHLALEASTEKATLYQANGSTVPFTEAGGGFTAPNWSEDTLVGTGSTGYTLMLPDQTKLKFSGTSGRLESVVDRNGNATTVSYSAGGALEAITDPAGRQIKLTYNAEGLVESASDPMGHVVKYTYEAGNLKTVTEPGETSPRWQFRYDSAHEILGMIDGRGHETTNEYNASRQVIAQVDPAGRKLRFEYQPRQTKITNQATGEVTLEEFNGLDLLTSITRAYGTASASTYSYAYNGAGQVIGRTDPNGHTTTYTYDPSGNRTSTLDPDGYETSWTYDSTHDVISTTTPSGETTTIKRNADGEAESVSRPAPGGATQTTEYGYDSHGDLTSVTDPLKRVWKYEYDAYGDRTSETDPEGDERTWAYNEDSQEISTTSPRGNAAGAAYGAYGAAVAYTTNITRDPQGRPLTVSESALTADYLGKAEGWFLEAPRALAVSPVTEDIFVANEESSRIQIYSPAGVHLGEFGSTRETGENDECSAAMCEPTAITVDSEGHVWVAEPLNSRIREFSEAGALEETLKRPFGSGEKDWDFPFGVAVNAEHELFVSDAGNGRILEFKRGSTGKYNAAEATVFGSPGSAPGQFDWPEGLAIDPAGYLWVADDDNNRVQKCSPGGCEAFGARGTGEGQFASPEDVVVSGSTVLVADSGNNRVVELSENGGLYLGAFGSFGYEAGQIDWSSGVAFLSEAEALVLDAGQRTLEAWTAATTTSSTKYTYDADGNLSTVTDPDGQTTTYAYNADNQPTAVKEPNGTVTETGYDGAGAIVSQSNGDKQTTKCVRNALEQVAEVTDPLGRKTKKEYDPAGNLIKLTDAEGRTNTYTYDPDNRLTEVSYSEAATPSVKYEYNADGERTKMTDGTGTSIYAYDQLDRLNEAKDGHGDVVAYEYDLANEPTKITYPNGKAVVRSYDKAGRLHGVTDWYSNTTTFSYDADSDLTATTFPSGTGDVDEYAYGKADEMTSVQMRGSSGILASVAYTRDPDEQVTSSLSRGLPGEEQETDEYDEDRRLTKAGSSTYAYDAADNPTKAEGQSLSYNEDDELTSSSGTSYSYDEVGERVKATPASGPATTYGYDQAGNLTSVSRAKEGSTPAIEDTYAYNGDGLRTSQTVSGTTTYLTWDVAEEMPLLLNDGTNNYIYGPDDLPVEQVNNSTGAALFMHHDQQGSTRLLTRTSGAVEGAYTYNAYGDQTGHTGSASTALGYDGQYTNSDTGLIYMRARTYDPTTAQFLTVDPLEAILGELYVYAGDNPVNNIDPSGLEAIPIPIDGPEAPACLTPETIGPCIVVGGGGYIITEGVKSIVSAWAGEEAGSNEGEALVKQQAEEAEQASQEECGQESPRSLPYRGEPNSTSVVDRGNGTGQIRDYGPDGLPLRDFDFGHDHGFGDPHAHDWLEGLRGSGRPIGPNE